MLKEQCVDVENIVLVLYDIMKPRKIRASFLNPRLIVEEIQHFLATILKQDAKYNCHDLNKQWHDDGLWAQRTGSLSICIYIYIYMYVSFFCIFCRNLIFLFA